MAGADRVFDAPIDRAWDHLEAIASTLADLRGAGSLAHELIQNADDAKDATRLTFRFTDDALIVEDDGGFTRCDDLRSDPCAWELAGRRCCDFHAFAKLGGGTKKHDPETTGAFGIGFLSVYQVTDQPEIFSAGIHWVIDERNQKALPCRKCGESHIRTGTRIVLPWAEKATWLRKKLDAEVVTAQDRRNLVRAFIKAIPESMLFLHQLKRIDVVDGDKPAVRFRRTPLDGEVKVSGPHGTEQWLVMSASFEDAVAGLRTTHSQMERRPAVASVAVLPGAKVDGHLYATLPTQLSTELPLHLNATFFPRRDRKGILLEAGPEAEWNRAAIDAAADLLAENVTPLARALGPEAFWTLIQAASKLDSHRTSDARALTPFWVRLEQVVPSAEVMWTSGDEWEVVERTVLPPKTERSAALLAELNVPTVSRDIRSQVPWRRLGLRLIDLTRLVEALEHLDLDENSAVGDLPEFLQDEGPREALGALVAELVNKTPPDEDLEARIRALPIWGDTDGRFHSFDTSYLVDKVTAGAFGPFDGTPFIVWRKRGAAKTLGELGDWFGIEQAVNALTGADDDDFTVPRARRLLKWLQGHARELSDEQVEELRDVPLLPTSNGLQPARKTVKAGGFKDHLAVTGVLDVDAVKGLEDIIKRLAVKALKFVDYLRVHLPQAVDERDEVSTDGLVELIRECARRRDEIDGDHALSEMLSTLAWIPCRDDQMRSPRKVYFDGTVVVGVLGKDAPLVAKAIARRSGAADFLRDLGAENSPRAEDVVARVERLIQEPPNDRTRAAVLAVLAHLGTRERQLRDDASPLRKLRDLAWLPADGDRDKWYEPGELHVTRWKRLFSSAGTFIWLRRTEQDRLSTTLTAIGVRPSPSVAEVVSHVANLAAGGEAPPGDVLKWLDARADDDDIALLSDVAFLPGRDGALYKPDTIFRDTHRLKEHLPVLEARVAKHTRLLDALVVARRPAGRHAVPLLLELTAHMAPGDVPASEAAGLIRACWDVIALDREYELDALKGCAVVLAEDGCVWRTNEVVVNDQPGTVRWLSPDAQRRVVGDLGIGSALRKAGVEPLSARLVAHVVGRSRARRDVELESELVDRQPLVARVIVAEHGELRELLTFAKRLRARSVPQLRVRYSLDGIDGVSRGSLVDRNAHYDSATGELFVQGEGLDIDWDEVALCLKEAVLPSKGPAVTLALEMVLGAESPEEATAWLTKHGFDPLPDERWHELREVLADWETSKEADAEAAGEADDEPDDDETSDDEDKAADGGDEASEAEAEDEEPEGGEAEDLEPEGGESASGADEEEDHETDDEAGAEGTEADEPGADPAGVGAGGSRSSDGGSDGSRGDSRNGGDGRRGGTGGRTGGRDGRSRRGGRSSADRRLVSYVASDEHEKSRNESSGERSAAGDAGVELVMAQLRNELAGQGLTVEKMPDMNKGYDIEVLDREGDVVRYIEVKSTEDKWGLQGVGLSSAQFWLAAHERERFWLYVVEHLYQQEARIWWIQNPARRITAFQFDEGWSKAAEGSAWVAGARRPKPASRGSES